jgi:hypothetical protein
MPMPVMDVGHMSMFMLQCLVHMGMGVRFAAIPGEIMGVPVMCVVFMAVGVPQQSMPMPM